MNRVCLWLELLYCVQEPRNCRIAERNVGRKKKPMEKRRLGKTDARLSVVGFGGIILSNVTDADACRHVAAAVDRGINYFDVGPAYGEAEQRLGPALQPYRNNVFLACKTLQRSADEAMNELHRSLKRLKTDHFDLYQLHFITSLEQVDQVMGPGGAMEAIVQAQKQGLIRYIGFSAHLEEAAVRLFDEFPFDSMMFPINRQCWVEGNFGPAAVEKAQQSGAAVLAIKSMAKRPWRKDEHRKWPNCWYAPVDILDEAKAAIAFTLSKPVTSALCPGHAELLWLACDALEALGDDSRRAACEFEFHGEPIFRSNT